MGRIVTVASGKGGDLEILYHHDAGRNVGGARYSVAVIDADPNACFAQCRISYMRVSRLTVRPKSARTKSSITHSPRLAVHDVVLVDTAGFGNATAAFAAGTADFVLVPVMPDRASAVEALRMVRQVRSFGKAGAARDPGCAHPITLESQRTCRAAVSRTGSIRCAGLEAILQRPVRFR